jgi:hypothetical protein
MPKRRALGLATAALLSTACDVPRPPPARAPDPAPPTIAAPAAAAAAGCELPPAALAGPDLGRMNARAHEAAARVKGARRAVVTEGEDATSASATVTWTAPDGAPVKLRWVWNGGCCSSPEVHDLVFAGDGLIKEVVFVAPRDDAAALMRGDEPRRPIATEELLFRRGRLVFWAERQGRHHVEPGSDPRRWCEREARTLDRLPGHGG